MDRKNMKRDTTSLGFFSYNKATLKTRTSKSRAIARYFMSWLRNYCENTSLQGFKYLVQRGVSTYEKTFWAIAIFVMLIGSGWLIFDQVNSFMNSPTLITFESSQRPIRNIPLPAVTVCPSCQLHKSFFNLTQAFENRHSLNEEEKKMFDFSMMWCVRFMNNKTNLEENSYNSSLVRSFAAVVNGPEACEDFAPVLSWSGVNTYKACRLTQPIQTRYGACFSFNLLPIDQVLKRNNMTAIRESWATQYLGKAPVWHHDIGYLNSTDNIPLEERMTPWPGGDGDIINRIILFLRMPRQGCDQACHNVKQVYGFMHNPAEQPSVGHTIFTVNAGEHITIFPAPKIYSIDPRLAKWEPLKRGCYLQTERQLRYFTTYTQRNCERECTLNYSLSVCGCAPFDYPRFEETPVCGSHKIQCYLQSEDKLDTSACECLPSCFELEFEIGAMTRFAFSWPGAMIDYKPDWSKYWYTSVEIVYKMRYVQGVRRDVLIGASNLIANIGGLFSLFLGFTMISLFEVVYFLTFRSWNYFRKIRIQRLTVPKKVVLPDVYYQA